MVQLLDPKNQLKTHMKLHDIEERLQDLVSRCGIDDSDAFVHTDGAQERIVEGEAGLAEVLELPSQKGSSPDSQLPGNTAPELQETLSGIQDELRSFSEELEALTARVARKTACARSQTAPSSSSASAPLQGTAEDKEQQDEAALALEVAKRSSWYVQPPPVAPDALLLDVSSSISVTRIKRCPSRPRTAHPKLFVTKAMPANEEPCRPHTAGAGALTQAEMPAEQPNFSAGASAMGETETVSSPRCLGLEGAAEHANQNLAEQANNDEASDSEGPVDTLAMSWRVA